MSGLHHSGGGGRGLVLDESAEGIVSASKTETETSSFKRENPSEGLHGELLGSARVGGGKPSQTPGRIKRSKVFSHVRKVAGGKRDKLKIKLGGRGEGQKD